MAPPAIMDTQQWLTRDFLEDVLNRNCEDRGGTVESFDACASTTKGDNYASTIHRVIVTYKDTKNRHKIELIVKSFPAGEGIQDYLKEMRFFDKEIAAYSKLIPAMNRLLEAPIVAPKFYATDRENTVILEDLSSRGFKMADRRKRLDLDHTYLALKALARFHALSYAVVKKDPDFIHLFVETTKSERMKEMEKKFTPKLYKDLASIVETWSGYERFSDKILSLCDEIQELEEKCLNRRSDAFNVLIHGDCWVNNMLFRYNKETQNVEEVCLIDLQVVRYTSPAVDLQYFLASSLADGIRNNNEDELLEVYHQELIKTLECVGMDSSMYSIDDLKKDYDEKIPFGFHVGILVLGAVAADPNEAFDFETISEESWTDDSANPLGKTFRGKGFKHVFQNHLMYYEKKGFL